MEGKKSYNDAELDVLAAARLAVSMLSGPATHERRILLRLAMHVMFQMVFSPSYFSLSLSLFPCLRVSVSLCLCSLCLCPLCLCPLCLCPLCLCPLCLCPLCLCPLLFSFLPFSFLLSPFSFLLSPFSFLLSPFSCLLSSFFFLLLFLLPFYSLNTLFRTY
jgi:WASH complex subunit 7, N-terminal